MDFITEHPLIVAIAFMLIADIDSRAAALFCEAQNLISLAVSLPPGGMP